MEYILSGNEKDVANVIQEQRIRVGRGVILITPISECGLIREEDARKTLDDQLAARDAKISEHTTSLEEKDKMVTELTASLAEKDGMISTLTTECDGMRTRIAELETAAIDDNKNLPADDSKVLSTGDSKNADIAAVDKKTISPAEVKKPGRPKNSN